MWNRIFEDDVKNYYELKIENWNLGKFVRCIFMRLVTLNFLHA